MITAPFIHLGKSEDGVVINQPYSCASIYHSNDCKHEAEQKKEALPLVRFSKLKVMFQMSHEKYSWDISMAMIGTYPI